MPFLILFVIGRNTWPVVSKARAGTITAITDVLICKVDNERPPALSFIDTATSGHVAI